MAKNCPQCGAQVGSKSVYCNKCGEKIPEKTVNVRYNLYRRSPMPRSP